MVAFYLGFRKIEAERWEFANQGFLIGQRHLLKNIKRRTTFTSSTSSSYDASCNELRKEKQMLIKELLSLRQQQQSTKIYIKSMEQRIEGAEKKHKQMMSFLARAMQSPLFLHQLLKQRYKRIKEIEDKTTNSKRGYFSMSELEVLALEMQGYSKQRNFLVEEDHHLVGDRELDDGFWEELLSDESLDSTSP